MIVHCLLPTEFMSDGFLVSFSGPILSEELVKSNLETKTPGLKQKKTMIFDILK